jgi:hypothetical protein
MIGNAMGIDQALALMDMVAADPGVLHFEEGVPSQKISIASSTRKDPVALLDMPYKDIPASEAYF